MLALLRKSVMPCCVLSLSELLFSPLTKDRLIKLKLPVEIQEDKSNSFWIIVGYIKYDAMKEYIKYITMQKRWTV